MGTITYQVDTRTIGYIYKASSGGTVFSSNYNATAAFDYFDNTAVVNDCLYIGLGSYGGTSNGLSKVLFNVGTALSSGVTVVWEFYQRDLTGYLAGESGTVAGWYPIPSFSDETTGFTTTGSKAFKFGLPYGWLNTTINSINALWIRARITAVTYTTGAATFTGTGLNDATSGGTYSGTGNSATFDIEIDGTGTPDTFKWRKNAGTWNTGVAITGAAQTLSDGIKVTFAATTGHTLADKWSISVTSITEGGANSTTAVKGYDAEVNIDDYTDGSPCTLKDISDYLTTNASWLKKVRNNNYYDFKEVCLDINSRLLSRRETIEFGYFGVSGFNGYYDLSYLQMGDKHGSYYGKDGGVLIVNMDSNTWAGSIATTTKFYGTTILCPIGYAAGGFGYPAWAAETLGCALLNINPIPSSSGVIANCYINHGGTWICSGWFGYFGDNKVIIPNEGSGFNALGLFYNTGFSVRNLDYQFTNTSSPTNGYIISFYNSAANSNSEWTFIDTKTNLPERGTASTYPRMFRRTTANATDWGKVWKYDDSAGTYTDITTACNNTTVNDVDLSGDVGDIFYFGKSSAFYNMWLDITSTYGANDYEYTFENYYNASIGWTEFEYKWDSSNNFAQNGKMYFSCAGVAYGSVTALSVNGYSGYWIRMKIKKKGSGTPLISRIRGGSEQAQGLWDAYEKYTCAVKVLGNGTALQNATVELSQGGTIYSTGTTNVNGDAVFIGDELIKTATTAFTNSSTNSYETFTATGRDITSAINTSAFGYCGQLKPISFESGKTYRLSYNLTLNSGTAPTINLESSIYGGGTIYQTVVATASAGQQTVDFVATFNGGAYITVKVGNGVATNFSMTGISLKEVSTSYPCTYRHWYFDPINYSTTYFNIAEDVTSAWKAKISATGYETQEINLTMTSKKELVVDLKPIIPAFVTDGDKVVLRNDPTNYITGIRHMATVIE